MNASLVNTPIAIVGMACRLPGADGLDAYWNLLLGGREAVTEMPTHKLDRELYYHPEKGRRGKTYSTRVGLIEERPIDLARTPLTSDDLRDSDLCHQIMCETAAAAVRHAGLDPFHMPAGKMGVYIGHSGGSPAVGDYGFGTALAETLDYLRDVPQFASLPEATRNAVLTSVLNSVRNRRPTRSTNGMPENGAHAAAALVAKALKLSGPQMVIDAACASSLVALAMGIAALQQGTIESAIVGGASINKSDSLILFSHAQSCSAGSSRPFDQDADGLIGSEGYVALVVKTLQRARADGDRICAVIRGLGLSSDGRGRSLWAPRKEGQVEAMRRAYGPGIDPARVEYMEAHATSTQVGDATEVEALREFFTGVASGKKIPIGSVKSNIGHTLETAGMAGLVKSVLAINNGIVPPSINVRKLNQTIPWSDLPFFVAREATPWPRASIAPRRAAVNAFGIGGLNVHVVVDEYDPQWDYFTERPAVSGAIPNAAATSLHEPIAVIGRGVVLPGAFHIRDFSKLAAEDSSRFTDPSEARWRGKIGVVPGSVGSRISPSCRAGYVVGYEYDWRKFKIPPKQLAQANPLQFMLLDAARQALEEAGYDHKDFDHSRTAVVVGSSFGGEFGNQLQAGLRLPEVRLDLTAELVKHGVSSAQAAAVADAYEETLLEAKPALLDETGSFTASTLASRITKTLDLMGGALAIDSADGSALAALDAACGMLRSGACSLVLCAGAARSLDLPTFELMSLGGRIAGAPGEPNRFTGKTIPGEGVALVLLKRLADAQRDGDRILGIVHDVSAENADVTGNIRPHEADALEKKIGHTLSAHGLTTLVGALENGTNSVRREIRTVTHYGLDYTASVSIGAEPVKIAEPAKPIAAIVPKTTPVVSSASVAIRTLPTRIFRIGARSEAELTAKIQTARANLAAFSAGGGSFANDDRHRLAFTASDEKTIAARLDLALQQTTHPAARTAAEEQGVYLRSVATGRRIAFLFPGQGSQYPNMLRGLYDLSPAARRVVEEADQWLAQHGDSFSALAWGDGARLGHDVWATQAAMLLADAMMLSALAERGISPDIVTGHSFGEFAAMSAARCWSLEQSLRTTRVRADAITASRSGHGGLLSIDSSAARIESLIAQHCCSVYLTHYNAPQQTVVGGDDRSLAEFTALLQAEGLSPRPLPVPSAFHTPLLADTQEPLARALQSESIHPPRTPLLSSVTNRFAAEPQELRNNLTAQMIEPVRFVQLIERLHADGVTVFIEVGPQQVLTRLSRQILTDDDSLIVPTDHPKRSAEEMLLRLQAALEACGAIAVDQSALSVAATIAAEILTFDATAARREKRRLAALGGKVVREVEPQIAPAIERFDATLERRQTNRAGRIAEIEPVVPAVAVKLVERKAVSPPPALAAIPQPSVIASESKSNTAALERFVIDFVVEQTGYPAEMIDLDWDMEADLGIDSIKRAQLFGELREFFEFESLASKGTSLDRFRTLRQIVDFLQDVPGKGAWLAHCAAHVEPPIQTIPASVLESDPVRNSPIESTPSNVANNLHAERFLVNFVVEQTGYPPEIVELDADLEADLGIDSIKKAQLFGELRDHFQMPVEHLNRTKLGEYRTLRQVLELLEESSASRVVVAPSAEEIAPHETSQKAFDIGLSQGTSEREQIEQWLQNRADEPWSGDDEGNGPAPLTPPLDPIHVAGFATGAEVHPENAVAYLQSHSTARSAILEDSPCEAIPLPVESIATRYVLSTEAIPLPENSPGQPVWHGAAIILGDNETALAIERRFKREGHHAYRIASLADPEAAIAELERIWRIEPVYHLFIATPRDRAAVMELSADAWKSRRQAGLLGPFWFARRWMKCVLDANVFDRVTIAATVSLGGDFGFGSNVQSVESGGITGLLKAIFIESWVNGFRATPIKTIDAPREESPETIVAALWRELASSGYEIESAVVRGERRLIRARAETVQPKISVPIARGGNWICTGGARGITAYVAKEIAERYGVRLQLIGTMPHPEIPQAWRNLSEEGLKSLKLETMQQARSLGKNPLQHWQDVEKLLEIDRTLREFADAGIHAEYHSCDIADRDALARVLETIRKQGAITGVLHGAGIGKDARFDRKDPHRVEQCFRAKVDGTIALMELTKNDPIRHFIGFGSISGRFGANGHTDYSAANDMLAKLIDRYRQQRPETHAVAFHWHAWGDVGMAMKPETRLALELVDMQFMPAREGTAHLLRELQAGAPHGEILVTDDRYHRMFYSAETMISEGDAETERKHPLLDDGSTELLGVRQITTLELDPLSEPFLIEHRLEDRPLLPVVAGLELLAEAASKLRGGERPTAILNVEALNGLRFFTDRSQLVKVEAKTRDRATYETCLTADFLSRDGKLVEANRGYLRGNVEFGEHKHASPSSMPRLDEVDWMPVDYQPQGGKFYLGPPLRALKRIRFGKNESWGRIFPPMLQELAGRRRSAEGWIVPSAALDACLYATGLLAWSQVQPGTALPFRFGRISLGRFPQPGEVCTVHSRFVRREGRYADFDFTLYGANGEMILDVADYRVVWLG